MATKDEILAAVKIVDDFAGNPTVGAVAELLRDLTDSATVTVKTSTPANEVRVVDVKETR